MGWNNRTFFGRVVLGLVFCSFVEVFVSTINPHHIYYYSVWESICGMHNQYFLGCFWGSLFGLLRSLSQRQTPYPQSQIIANENGEGRWKNLALNWRFLFPLIEPGHSLKAYTNLARPWDDWKWWIMKAELTNFIIQPECLHHSVGLPKKEVIQPHLPVRLPCYDFTPVISPAFGVPLLFRLG